jgi:hypothetical protein
MRVRTKSIQDKSPEAVLLCKCLTIGVSLRRLFAGVDNVWKQEKPEATLREMFDAKRVADSPTSNMCFVRRGFLALFDNGGRPRHWQSGALLKARAPIERSQGAMVCPLLR